MSDDDDITNSPVSSTFLPRPRAIGRGSVEFLQSEFECFTLAAGDALISTRGISQILAGTDSGNFRRFIDRICLRSQGFSLAPAVEFHPPDNNSVVMGYRTDEIIRISAQLLWLLFTKKLHESQVVAAQRAGLLLAQFANDGLKRAVWEATGYTRARREVSTDEKIAAALRLQAGKWRPLFEAQFFIEMAKLFRLELGADGHRPACFGAFLSEFFYEWFDEEVYVELKKRNPKPQKGKNHHQHLSDEARTRFLQHQREVLLLMRASESLKDFRMRFNAALKGHGLQLMLLAG